MWNKKQMILAVLALTGAMVFAHPAKAKEKEFVHVDSFVEEHSMHGLFSQCTEYFSVEDWKIQKADFLMNYNVSQLRDERLSDFTVFLNGEPFYSGRFTGETGEWHTLKISLPIRLIKEGVNELKVESYVRTEESLPCVDDVSEANWFNIAKDSAVSIVYTPQKQPAGIGTFYERIAGMYALENRKSALILPEQMTDTELTAASNLLAGISENAGKYGQKLVLFSEKELFSAAAKDMEYGIYVGEWSSLSGRIKSLLSAEAQAAAEKGAVMELVSLDEMQLLVVTGKDTEALKDAGCMFTDTAYMEQMKGKLHKVTAGEWTVQETPERLEYSYLSETGAYVNGSFRQEISIAGPSAGNRMLSPASEIYLKFRYSENLDFERSLMTVYINDIPIGSHKLSKEMADGDEAEFYIPADLKVSGDYQITAAFDLELEDAWCTLRQGEMPWAYLSPESMIKLVLAEQAPLLFEYYPAPFIENRALNQVLVALPEKPSKEDLAVWKGICLMLGRYGEADTEGMEVKTGATKEDCRGKNTIVIGTFADNALVRESNESLYFKFKENGTGILSNEKKRITEEAGKRMGTLQLLPSFTEEPNKGVLFITGADRQAMLTAAEYLLDEEELWKVSGDGCTADGDKLEAYRFKEGEESFVKTAKQLIEREDVFRFLVVTVTVSAVIILGLILILVKYFRKGKGGKRHERK